MKPLMPKQAMARSLVRIDAFFQSPEGKAVAERDRVYRNTYMLHRPSRSNARVGGWCRLGGLARTAS